MAASSQKRVAISVNEPPGSLAGKADIDRTCDVNPPEDGEATIVGDGEAWAEMTNLGNQGFQSQQWNFRYPSRNPFG